MPRPMLTFAAVLLLLAGCSVDARSPAASTPSRATVSSPSPHTVATSPGVAAATLPPVTLPPATGRFDYQLGGPDDPAGGLDIVVRDATAEPLAGAYNICYVNGFQTQPEESDRWLADHPDLLLTDGDGAPVVDPAWPDEYIFDPSTNDRRQDILAVVGGQIVGCAEDGFDAVEIDNLDTPLRFDDPTGGRVDPQGVQDLARAYVATAHQHGLAAGQKNAPEWSEIGRQDIGFDFAVAEECAAYDECDNYRKAYGEQVLQVEYTDNLPVPFAEICSRNDTAPLTILRDRGLASRDSPDHRFEQCPALG